MTEKTFEAFIKSLKKRSQKVGGAHPPISELVKKERKRLKVKKIYSLKESRKGLYLFMVRNYKKPPKYRYFIAISLAGQSSDLLVYLAKDFALKKEVKLLQYSIYPEHNRVNLLGLKEITEVEKFEEIIDILGKYKNLLKGRMERIRDIVLKDQKL
jgi:hypothetical protein